MNENEDTTHKNIGHVTKAVLTVKFIATNIFKKKKDVKSLTFPLNILER